MEMLRLPKVVQEVPRQPVPVFSLETVLEELQGAQYMPMGVPDMQDMIMDVFVGIENVSGQPRDLKKVSSKPRYVKKVSRQPRVVKKVSKQPRDVRKVSRQLRDMIPESPWTGRRPWI